MNAYIYYDTTENEWKPATLEQLANLNDPNLPICELNTDGTPGPQTTYATLETRAVATANTPKPTPTTAKPTPAPTPAPPTTPAPQPADLIYTPLAETPAERDRRYTYRLVRICCSFSTATLICGIMATSKNALTTLLLIGLVSLAILAFSHDYKKK